MTDNAQILDLARRLALEILAADHAAVERNIRVAQIPCDREAAPRSTPQSIPASK